MAIEERRNGRLYLYRKRREGERVVSEYVGGSVTDLMEYLAEKQRREEERARIAAERVRTGNIDSRLDKLCSMTDEIAKQALIAAGYRQRKGEWRKRRCQQ